MPLRASVLSGLRVPAITDGVVTVLAPGTPVEIFWAVVCRIVITVESMHAFGARADERFEDEVVDLHRAPGTTQANHSVARLRVLLLLQDS